MEWFYPLHALQYIVQGARFLSYITHNPCALKEDWLLASENLWGKALLADLWDSLG